jgi:hypothetical protein
MPARRGGGRGGGASTIETIQHSVAIVSSTVAFVASARTIASVQLATAIKTEHTGAEPVAFVERLTTTASLVAD